MIELADRIERLDEAQQKVFSLCVVERIVVAIGHFLDPAESEAIDDILRALDELWDHVLNCDELTSDEQEKLRHRINAARPRVSDSFWLLAICGILKSVLNVFRDREHAYEISRLGIELATQSKLNESTEAQNQSRIIDQLASSLPLTPANLVELRAHIRELPINKGKVQSAEGRD